MAGLSADRLARIAPVLEAAVARGDPPGAVALVARGETVHVATAGVQNIARNTPMRRDTLFRTASMTKAMLAVVTLTLVEEARIALDDPIDRWLPEMADRRVLKSLTSPVDATVEAVRPITVRDLLTMRMGIGAIMAPPGTYPVQAAIREAGLGPGADPLAMGPDEFMARLGRLPLLHQPGEGWLYHTGMDVLAVLLARLEGKPLPQIVAARLVEPLGLADTGFSVPKDRVHRLATAYAADPAGGPLVDRDEHRRSPPTEEPRFPNEVISTADDYLAFCRMLLAGGLGPRGRILSRASVRLMMTDQITPDQKAAWPFIPGFWDRTGWGLGGAVVTRRDDVAANPGTFFWSGGVGTHFILDPGEGLIAVLLTQRLMQAPNDGALGRDLFTLAASAIED